MTLQTFADMFAATLMVAGRGSSSIGLSWRSGLAEGFCQAKPSTTRTASGETTGVPTLNYGRPGNRTAAESRILWPSLALSFVATAEEFIGRQLLAALRSGATHP